MPEILGANLTLELIPWMGCLGMDRCMPFPGFSASWKWAWQKQNKVKDRTGLKIDFCGSTFELRTFWFFFTVIQNAIFIFVWASYLYPVLFTILREEEVRQSVWEGLFCQRNSKRQRGKNSKSFCLHTFLNAHRETSSECFKALWRSWRSSWVQMVRKWRQSCFFSFQVDLERIQCIQNGSLSSVPTLVNFPARKHPWAMKIWVFLGLLDPKEHPRIEFSQKLILKLEIWPGVQSWLKKWGPEK